MERELRRVQVCLGAAVVAVICIPLQAVQARQTTVSGEISGRFEYQERNYDQGSYVNDAGQTVIIIEDLRGDERNYILSPRFTLTSRGIDDLLEFTVAPALNYDDIYSQTDIDWDLRLLGEKRLTRNWNLSLTDRYYQGDDPVRANELQTATISPDTGEVTPDEEATTPGTDEGESLTERYGRRRFWRNTFDLSTDYTYAEGSTIGAGYNFGVLRNQESDIGGYTDYDRHQANLNLTYRFNPKWQLEGEGWYVRGLFEDTGTIVVIYPDGSEVLYLDSDDLGQYNGRVRLNYNHTPHLNYFGEYRYLSTDYDSGFREDYVLHEGVLGVDYALSPHMSVIFSGGPVVGSFENSSTESDYNLYGSLNWDLQYGQVSLIAEKGYDQSNFDGRRSGLTGFWRTGVSCDYALTEYLQAIMSASYWNYDRLQYAGTDTIILTDSDFTLPEFGRTLYTEKSYDVGVTFNYTFARWYTLTGGYRYYNHESDLTGDISGNYEEHRVIAQLSFGKELFRW